MSNTNAPRGLEPVRKGATNPPNEYAVYGSAATAIYIGDPVARRADGTIDLATAGAGNYILGAMVGCFDSDGVPQLYVPSSPGSGYTAMVTDDPNQEYIVQEDGATTDLALADRGNNVDLVSGSGSTSTGLSGWQLDSDTKSTAASLQMRIIRKYEDPNNAIGDYCRWICKINYHQNLQGSVGAGI